MTNTGAPWAPGLQDVITAVSLEIERGVDDTSAACRQQLSCEMSWHTAPSFWPGPLQPNTRNIYVLIMRVLTAWRIYMASSFPKLLTGPLLIWILLSCTELKSRSLKKKKKKKWRCFRICTGDYKLCLWKAQWFFFPLVLARSITHRCCSRHSRLLLS